MMCVADVPYNDTTFNFFFYFQILFYLFLLFVYFKINFLLLHFSYIKKDYLCSFVPLYDID